VIADLLFSWWCNESLHVKKWKNSSFRRRTLGLLRSPMSKSGMTPHHPTLTTQRPPRHPYHRRHSKSKSSPSMVRCRADNCTKRAVVGFELYKPLYCGTHKHANMFYVLQKVCAFPKCTQVATHGTADKVRRHCAKHACTNMTRITNPGFSATVVTPRRRVRPTSDQATKSVAPTTPIEPTATTEIKWTKATSTASTDSCKTPNPPEKSETSKRPKGGWMCKSDNCRRRATLGFFGQRPERCSSHTAEGMINVVAPRCTFSGCDTIANYRTNDPQVRFCGIHAPTDVKDSHNAKRRKISY
jgi:hypothetical protein